MHMALTLRRAVEYVQHSCILGMPATLDPDEIDPGATGHMAMDFVDHRRSRPQLAERAPCRFARAVPCIETTRPPLELFRGHRREKIAFGGFLHDDRGERSALRTAYSPPRSGCRHTC